MAEARRTDYGDVSTVFNVDAADDSQWEALADYMAGFVFDDAFDTVRRVLDTVRSRACSTVVVEHSYIDVDYRSEYSVFWSRRFEDRPSQAMRVHFFEAEFEARDFPVLPESPGYLGYCVIRPTELGAVGRTVIAPPAGLVEARLTKVIERPSLYGNPLEVAGVPFCQQDGELLRCAHAAAWVCHYIAFHHRVIARRLTAEIAQLPSTEGTKHRPLPSTGLTGEQLQGVFSAMGIPAYFLEAARLPRLPADMPWDRTIPWQDHNRLVKDERVFRVVCKYLNSGFPVVVLTEADGGNHAFTLVGWTTSRSGRVCLVACDDGVGPYETIESPTIDGAERGEWRGFMIPLPAKVFLTGEAAENRARQIVSAEFDEATLEEDAAASDLSSIAPHLKQLGGPVSVRSRLLEGRRYKAMAARQDRDAQAVRVARMAALPHWVWVVEFQDRRSRDKGDPCVLAEIVFDSTSHDERPAVDLLCTRSIMIDPRLTDEAAQESLGLGRLDGRKWRSLVSDPRVSDREYGQQEPFGAPPGSMTS